MKNLAFAEIVKNKNFELFPLVAYEQHHGACNLVLAMVYQEAKRKKLWKNLYLT